MAACISHQYTKCEAVHANHGSRFFLGIFWAFLGILIGFMCVDVAKTARVTGMRLMPKPQVFLG